MDRRRVLFAAKAVVSLLLLSWVLYGAISRDGVGSLSTHLHTLRWQWVLGAVALQLGAVAAGILRWRLLLSGQGLTLRLGWLTRTYLIGRFIGAFTPSTAGLDVYRAVAVARHTGSGGKSASVILVEKLIGLVALSLVCLLLLPFGAERFLGPFAALAAVLVGVGSCVGLIALRRPALARPLLVALPGPFRERGSRLLDAIAATGMDNRILGKALIWGLMCHLLTATVFVATGLSLGMQVPPSSLLVVGNAIVIATLVPISVGGIGVREGVAVVLLATVGIGASDATLMALLGYFTGQFPAILGGILSTGSPARAEPATGLDAVATPHHG